MLPPPTPLRPGELFAGEFRVVAPLGTGGMGAVWLVEQLRTGKQRALKVMHPALVADARLLARFELESRISSRIESDHVVEIIDAGVDPATGAPWIAMELLKGSTLAATVDTNGPLSVEAAREVFAQLGHALAAAHDAGIVHRDLKPENVFLAVPRRPGARFTLKVLDFGIAKLMAEVGSRATAAIGTPLWMAPEQTQSGIGVAPATDVWSLGLLAFWVLTGRSYWLGALDDRGGTVAILREIVIEPMPSAGQRALELGVTAKLPAGFDGWFARATAREPSARFPDARAACAALDAVLAGVLEAPAPAWTPTPLPQSVSRAAAPPQAAPMTRADPAARLATPLPVPVATSTPPRSRAALPQAPPESGDVVGSGATLRALLIALIVVAAAVTFGSLGLLVWNRSNVVVAPPPAPSGSLDPGALAIDEEPDATPEEEPSSSASSPSGAHSLAPHPSATWTTRPTSTAPRPSSTPSVPSTTTSPSTKPTVAPSASSSSPPLIGGFDRNAAAAALARVVYKDCGVGAGPGTVHVIWAATGTPIMVRVEAPYERAIKRCVRSRFETAIIPPFFDTPHALAWKISL
jgi:serine/threonine protein kinase